MPPPVDPHTMVALMAGVAGANHDHIDRYTNITGGEIINGMLDDEEGMRRTFPVLDAFASLSVSEPEHQVVAIALKLKQAEKKICFTIAENGEVKKSLTDYLLRIWELLQQLGMEFAAKREQGENPQQWKNYKGNSPGMPAGVGTDHRLAIFTRIYDYTKKKNRFRMEKWWPRLVEFMNRFERVSGKDFMGDEEELITAFQALHCAYNVYDAKEGIRYKDVEHWKALYALLECATQRIRRLTDDSNNFCEDIASAIGSFCLNLLIISA